MRNSRAAESRRAYLIGLAMRLMPVIRYEAANIFPLVTAAILASATVPSTSSVGPLKFVTSAPFVFYISRVDRVEAPTNVRARKTERESQPAPRVPRARSRQRDSRPTIASEREREREPLRVGVRVRVGERLDSIRLN